MCGVCVYKINASEVPCHGGCRGRFDDVHVHHGIIQEWDIDALEESTRYDGFKPTDQVIV